MTKKAYNYPNIIETLILSGHTEKQAYLMVHKILETKRNKIIPNQEITTIKEKIVEAIVYKKRLIANRIIASSKKS